MVPAISVLVPTALLSRPSVPVQTHVRIHVTKIRRQWPAVRAVRRKRSLKRRQDVRLQSRVRQVRGFQHKHARVWNVQELRRLEHGRL